jgi:hypothetical protein
MVGSDLARQARALYVARHRRAAAGAEQVARELAPRHVDYAAAAHAQQTDDVSRRRWRGRVSLVLKPTGPTPEEEKQYDGERRQECQRAPRRVPGVRMAIGGVGRQERSGSLRRPVPGWFAPCVIKRKAALDFRREAPRALTRRRFGYRLLQLGVVCSFDRCDRRVRRFIGVCMDARTGAAPDGRGRDKPQRYALQEYLRSATAASYVHDDTPLLNMPCAVVLVKRYPLGGVSSAGNCQDQQHKHP